MMGMAALMPTRDTACGMASITAYRNHFIACQRTILATMIMKHIRRCGQHKVKW